MDVTCFRDEEAGRESRRLSAKTYNLAITLLARSADGHLFVPIRSMQYMAIIDAEEFVFLDGERRCWVDIAWRNFKPQIRSSLEQPVDYDVVFYREGLSEVMTRLQSEFPTALQALVNKEKLDGSARIIKFRKSSA